ncbi:FAD-dependent monooxygenase [Sphingobium sp. AN558]|uniref:NAD(P)/FAD-dependent oxidoreductase n=1 Tax=Sphingobium sp. AN558 TaxID=3133442 RepID=UPI0030C09BAA
MPLIVGGGPAGAAAGIRLAQSGMRPVIVERTAEPADMLCGGFLSWNSVEILRDCGVDPMALGAHALHRARIFAGGRAVAMMLPAASAGLSRQSLDKALLDRAARAGVEIRRGVTVRSIEGGSVRYADGTVESPDHLILATGKHDVRGCARPVVSNDPSVGLRWRFRAGARLADAVGDAIELHLFRHGYAGLVMQEEGAANLCLAVRRSAFVAAGQSADAMLATILAQSATLGDRLAGESLGPAQAIANIPYGWRARDRDAMLYRVGDQLGVIPSLAGEGVGIALATGMRAADAIIAGMDPQTYQDRTSRRIGLPIACASLIWSIFERPDLARLAMPVLTRIPGMATAALRWTRIGAVPAKSPS